ncbi:MAG: DUF6623 family protein [Acidimicrobiia bacterium]
MGRYDMWIHGVSAVVEHPVEGMNVRHAGNGMILQQPAGSWNWVHITVPTPTIIDGDAEVAATRIAFTADVNENARIKDVHVYMGGQHISADSVDWSGTRLRRDSFLGEPFFDPFRDGIAARAAPRIRHADGPLTLCLRVEFLDGAETGEICLTGAGAAFDT